MLTSGQSFLRRKTHFLSLGDKKMQSYTKLFIFICLAALVSAGTAQERIERTPTGQSDVLSFPYIAEITGDDVYVRSGAGTNYYQCGKLNKADRVKVVSTLFGWSRIVPPAGSFSWISKQYVDIDAADPAIGIVTGDNVRVYAGSDFKEPIHSTTLQCKLNKGEKVSLLGEEKSDYYKIAPPAGAYLWVSTEYTKPISPVAVPVEPNLKADTGPAAPEQLVATAGTPLEKYKMLEKQIDAEKAKPIAQQDYTGIKEALGSIAEDKQADKAARYAKFTLEQIKHYELVFEVGKAVQLQDTQLKQIEQRIEKARTTNLAQIVDLGKFAVIGRFQTSSVYGSELTAKYYRIIDQSGKTLCYALPDGPASRMDLSGFTGRKVGLVGTIEPHPETAGAVVRFTEITAME
jgi:SH3-like domain-containing protein